MPDNTQLTTYRQIIDQLDKNIVALLNQRAAVVHEISLVKRQSGLTTYDPMREQQLLDKLTSLSAKSLTDDRLSRVYGLILQVMKESMDDEVCYYLGPEGTYSHVVAKKMAPGKTLVPVEDLSALYQKLQQNPQAWAILPRKNNYVGEIASELWQKQSHSLEVQATHDLEIEFSLLAKKGTALTDIQEVYSKQEALQQCGEYLGKNMPKVQLKPVNSTAAAARNLSEGQAVIGSKELARIYGLEVLEGSITMNKKPVTTFMLAQCVRGNR